MQEYRKIREIIERYELKLKSKDEQIEIYKDQIKFLREVIKKNADKPVKIINENVGNKTDQSRNMKITSEIVNASGAGVFNLGDISGTVANTINQLPASSDLENPGIKELLLQLKEIIEEETELDKADKYDALEEVQNLVEAYQDDDLYKRKSKAEKSLRMLGRIFKGLPAIAALMNICKEILPAIALMISVVPN